MAQGWAAQWEPQVASRVAPQVAPRSSSRLAAVAQEVPVVCPLHEDYQLTNVPAWPKDYKGAQLDIGVYGQENGQDDHIFMEQLKEEVIHNPIYEKKALMRSAEFYKRIPQSYKDRMWRKEADHLVANRHDAKLAADTKFLPTLLRKPIWAGSYCVADCPGGKCPWIEDCRRFDARQTLWDKQIQDSQTCYDRWMVEKLRRHQEFRGLQRAERIRIKKEELKARLAAEKELSRTMFGPTQFDNRDDMMNEIVNGIKPVRDRDISSHPEHALLQSMIRNFSSKTSLTYKDFQCLIADYFHDGLPGFRIASRREPRISGIKVHNRDIIGLGRSDHQTFMYKFLKNVLRMMKGGQVPKHLRTLLNDLESEHIPFTLPDVTDKLTTIGALKEWSKNVGMISDIEDSIRDILELPPLNDTHKIELLDVRKKHYMILYHEILRSKKQNIIITFKKEDIKDLTQTDADQILTIVLLVLFGPSYEQKIANNPSLFTFDAHKGHMNRIIAMSSLNDIYRLVTPYNVADSAMTEQFNKPQAENVDPEEKKDEEDAAAEVEQEDAIKAAEDAAVQAQHEEDEDKDEYEDEDEDESESDSGPPDAQQGKSIFAVSLAHAKSLRPGASAVGQGAYTIPDAIMSDTNMIFDDNWLIYYKAKGFARNHEYDFSMNIVDIGLHHYIQKQKANASQVQAKYNIPPSLYTIEAPFSMQATRGPSLNYLMMGLLRGTNSNVFDRQRTFSKDDDLYEHLCTLRGNVIHENVVKHLLPIYSIPVSTHALPLFKHIACAPLFAYHMLYDLQHYISALPSRIKWAGDREQYMILKGYKTGVFVTLDTTGYYCALANGVTSLLERNTAIHLMKSEDLTAEEEKMVSDTIERVMEEEDDAAKRGPRTQGQKRPALSAAKRKGGRNLGDTHKNTRDLLYGAIQRTRKNVNGFPQAKKGMYKDMFSETEKGSCERVRASLQDSTKCNTPHVLDRNYFFMAWLYPLVMAVNETCHDRHPAEHAYTILQDLKDHIHHPGLFPILQGQFIHAVSQIPNVSKELIAYTKDITRMTYEPIAAKCASLLKRLYHTPSSIFFYPVHKETLIGYLREMKEKLSKKYLSKDSTMDLLHALLTQEDETACLALSLLFERLHGRIQNGTSYLGQILGITGGPELKRVDDQEAWEHLTTVIEEDVQQIKALKMASTEVATPTETPSNPKMIRLSAKKHNVVRGPVYDKLKKDLRQLRSNRVRAMPMPMAAAVAGGSLRRTRRQAKKGSRRSQRSQCKD